MKKVLPFITKMKKIIVEVIFSTKVSTHAEKNKFHFSQDLVLLKDNSIKSIVRAEVGKS